MPWTPSDDQMTHMLMTRGWLTVDDVRDAHAASRRRWRRASALEVLIERGRLSRETVRAVLASCRQDRTVRALARERGLLRDEDLMLAARLQRGSRRSLLEILDETDIGDAAARRILRGALGTAADGSARREPPSTPPRLRVSWWPSFGRAWRWPSIFEAHPRMGT